jgi:hypothetical protein
MTQPEFLAWVEFYKIHPFDDRHRYYRPAALVARKMGGGEIDDLLNWLEPDPATAGYSQAALNSFKAHGIKPPPLKR